MTDGARRSITLDVTALRAFPAAARVTYRQSRDAPDPSRPFTELSGVRLLDVLALAGIAEPPQWRNTIVIAAGRDGSRAVFSWPEVAHAMAGAEALLFYERDRLPLTASEGPLAFFVPGAERGAERQVMQLQRIEVRAVRD